MLTVRVNPDTTDQRYPLAPDTDAQALLDQLQRYCLPGDEVRTEYVSEGAKRTAAHRWPFGPEVAKDMVGPIDRDGMLRGHSAMWRRFRITRFGRFGVEKVVGPPMWRLPRLIPRLKWKDGLVVALQAGWRYTLYTVIYSSQKRR